MSLPPRKMLPNESGAAMQESPPLPMGKAFSINRSAEPEEYFAEGTVKAIDEINDELSANLVPGLSGIQVPESREASMATIQSGTIAAKDPIQNILAEQLALKMAQSLDYVPEKNEKSLSVIVSQQKKCSEMKILQKITHIQKEIAEVETDIRAYERRNTHANSAKSTIVTYSSSFDSLQEIKARMGDLIKSKGYQDIIQCENPGDAGPLLTMKASQKLTECLRHTLQDLSLEPALASPAVSGPDTHSVSFELKRSTELENIKHMNDFLELEKRMSKIEAIIGHWKDKPELANISTTIDYLSQITMNLAPAGINERISTLNSALQELNKCLAAKKEERQDVDKGQIEILYSMIKGALEYEVILPEVIEKLRALKFLHDELAGCANKVIKIERSQSAINESLREAKKLLQSVKNSFGENMKVIGNNLKSLDARLEKVKL